MLGLLFYILSISVCLSVCLSLSLSLSLKLTKSKKNNKLAYNSQIFSNCLFQGLISYNWYICISSNQQNLPELTYPQWCRVIVQVSVFFAAQVHSHRFMWELRLPHFNGHLHVLGHCACDAVLRVGPEHIFCVRKLVDVHFILVIFFLLLFFFFFFSSIFSSLFCLSHNCLLLEQGVYPEIVQCLVASCEETVHCFVAYCEENVHSSVASCEETSVL